MGKCGEKVLNGRALEVILLKDYSKEGTGDVLKRILVYKLLVLDAKILYQYPYWRGYGKGTNKYIYRLYKCSEHTHVANTCPCKHMPM